MFVLATKQSVADRAIAALLASALVLLGVGAHVTAEAASLLDISDTITDSAPGASANHEILFTIPTGSAGVGVGETIIIDFDDSIDLASLATADIDLEVDGIDQDITGTDWTTAVDNGGAARTITFTAVAGAAAADEVITVQLGSNAAGGSTQIVNPSATGSYPVAITANADSGETRIAVVDTVTVSADVDTLFDFFISGLPTGYVVNGETTTQSGTTTTVPFGTLAPGSAEIVGQQLNVTTNAINGYSVTVETDQQLTSSNGAVIDSFSDASDITSAAAAVWAAPSGNIAATTTWGHWGMTAEDSTLTSGDDFGASLYSAVLTTPQEVMYHTGVTDGIVADQGSSTVAYKAEIMSFQEAADDYTATLTYIATPTF